MTGSDYADALAEWSPVEQAAPLRFPPTVVEQRPLMVVPTPLPAPPESRPRVDLLSVRLVATGVCAAGVGGGVDLAGQGIAAAGPWLWALAGVLVALAGLVALVKGHAAPSGSGNTTVTISGGKNRIGSVG
jgi:hypothetical protein